MNVAISVRYVCRSTHVGRTDEWIDISAVLMHYTQNSSFKPQSQYVSASKHRLNQVRPLIERTAPFPGIIPRLFVSL